MDADALRALQAPLKQAYRDDPATARVVMHATGQVDLGQVGCHVTTPLGTLTAGLHPAAGGDGRLACSGDMLLQALVACSGVTLAAVATAMAIPIDEAHLEARGEMDFRGTLGIDRSVPIGFSSVILNAKIRSTASDEQLNKLLELTERYCVVWQSLLHPGQFTAQWQRASDQGS